MGRKKLFRVATIPFSLNILLKGQLNFLNQYFEVTAVSSSGEDFEIVKKREKVLTKEIDMQRQISPLKDLLSLMKLYLYFKKEKPDIVHSITPKAGLLSMIAAAMAGVPVRMHTFTGLIFPSRTGKMQKLLIMMDRLLCRCATHIYPEGQGVRNDLINYKITDKPLKVIASGNVNGIDTAFFSKENFPVEDCLNLRLKLGIAVTDFVFVFVGRLVKDKGINELISAFKLIQSSTSDIQNYKILLVGPFEQVLDPLLPETLHEIKSNPAIISVGFQQDVRPFFAVADALVFPSYREGFPNVVMQAGSMNLPSIVTDINGCNEIILEGENGLIIPVKNVDKLSEAMIKLMNDKNLYHHLRNNSRAMIVDRYKQQLVWEALLQEYNEVVKT